MVNFLLIILVVFVFFTFGGLCALVYLFSSRKQFVVRKNAEFNSPAEFSPRIDKEVLNTRNTPSIDNQSASDDFVKH